MLIKAMCIDTLYTSIYLDVAQKHCLVKRVLAPRITAIKSMDSAIAPLWRTEIPGTMRLDG